jgi:hypothetical protein
VGGGEVGSLIVEVGPEARVLDIGIHASREPVRGSEYLFAFLMVRTVGEVDAEPPYAPYRGRR